MKIGDYEVHEYAQFWVYNLTFPQWEELQNHFDKSEQFFITSFTEFSIKKGDMILIHIKNDKKKQGGFIGYCQMLSDYQKNNTKFKIYQDDMTNKYYGKIDKFTYFQEPIHINKIEDSIKRFPDFRSLNSFKIRFLQGMIDYKQIPRIIGQQIMIQMENYEFEFKKEDTEPEMSSEKVSSCKISDDEYHTEEYYDDDQEVESYDDGYDLIKHKNGIVPIMIEPCKDFKMPDEDWDLEEDENQEIKKKAFISHYINCFQCDTTNNSNIDIIRLLQNSSVCFQEVDGYHDDFMNALEQYHEGRIYNPFLEENKTKLRLLYVKDDCDTYDQCILIEGCLFISKKNK